MNVIYHVMPHIDFILSAKNNTCTSELLLTQIRNVAFQKTCLDSPTRKSDHHKPVGLYPCHRQGGNQVFSRSKFAKLRQYHRFRNVSGTSFRLILFFSLLHSPILSTFLDTLAYYTYSTE